MGLTFSNLCLTLWERESVSGVGGAVKSFLQGFQALLWVILSRSLLQGRQRDAVGWAWRGLRPSSLPVPTACSAVHNYTLEPAASDTSKSSSVLLLSLRFLAWFELALSASENYSLPLLEMGKRSFVFTLWLQECLGFCLMLYFTHAS